MALDFGTILPEAYRVYAFPSQLFVCLLFLFVHVAMQSSGRFRTLCWALIRNNNNENLSLVLVTGCGAHEVGQYTWCDKHFLSQVYQKGKVEIFFRKAKLS